MEKVPRHYHTLPRTPERGAVRRQFALAPCRADVRDPFMRIRTRTAVSGKMLENSYDARVVQAVRKSAPCAATACGSAEKLRPRRPMAGGSGIHIHIQYGREIEIDPELPQHAAHAEGRAARGIGRAPAQLRGRRVRRKTVARLEAGHLAAFLIHGDKKRMPRRGPSQRGGQPFHLRRIADIARGAWRCAHPV